MAANSKGCGSQTLQENVQKIAARHMSGMAAEKRRIIERLRLVYQSADSSRGHFGSISCNSGCTAGGGNTAGMAAIQINMAANSKGCGAQTLQNVQKTAAKHMSGMAAKKLRIIQAAGTSDQSAAVAAQRVEETLQEWQLSKLWLRIQKAADLKLCRKNVQKTAAEHMSRMSAKKLRIVKKAAVYQAAKVAKYE